MTTIKTESGVSIKSPDGVQIRVGDPPSPTKRRGGESSGPSITELKSDGQLRDSLDQAQFELVEIVEIAYPDLTDEKRRSAATFAETQIELDGDNALLLVQDDEGLKWVAPNIPELPLSKRQAGLRSSKIVFSLSPFLVENDIRSDSRRTRNQTSGLGSKIGRIVGQARAYVLRYSIGVGVRTIGHLIDGNGPFGLVPVTGIDHRLWTPQEMDLSHLNALDRTGRVLILVHGTFSSTQSSFSDLAVHHPDFLRRLSSYDAVLGFDHKTLSESVETNAETLSALLKSCGLDSDVEIDAIGYSRGGLVLRHFCERHWPSEKMKRGRFVFVGSTLTGTLLASKKHWHQLLDLYTNTAVGAVNLASTVSSAASATLAVSSVIKSMGWFAKVVVDSGVDDTILPGLESMTPRSASITELHDGRYSEARNYYSIGADYEPSQSSQGLFEGFRLRLADGFIDRLFNKRGNDLVVHTASMTQIGASTGTRIAAERSLQFDRDEGVYHTIYFAQKQTVDCLSEWLLSPRQDEKDCSNEATVVKRAPRFKNRGGSAAGLRNKRARKLGEETRRARGSQQNFRNRFGADDARTEGDESQTNQKVRCAFEASCPETMEIGATENVLVSLSREAIEAAESDTHAVSSGWVDSGNITIRAIPLSGLKVKSSDEDEYHEQAIERVQVPTTSSKTTVLFQIQACELGLSRLLIQFEQSGVLISTLELKPVIIAAERGTQKANSSAPVMSHGDRTPHLTLQIFETRESGRLKVQFLASCDEPGINLNHSVYLDNTSLSEFSRAHLDQIEHAPLNGAEQYEMLLATIRAQGSILFKEFLPQEISKAVESHWADVSAIQVVSDGNPLPWELFYVESQEQFFAQKGLVRWPTNLSWGPDKLRLRPKHVRYICPEYDVGRWKLPGAREEVNFLKNRVFPGSKEWSATFKDLERHFSNAEELDLLHVACHGEASPKGRSIGLNIVLNNEVYFSSDLIRANLEFSENCRPIVFLNCCQLGLTDKNMTWVSGFTDSFLRPHSGSGAGAVIAPQWSIGDSAASNFARHFYDSMLDGGSVVEAARYAQLQTQNESDPTWLSYAIYAHPFAKVDDRDL